MAAVGIRKDLLNLLLVDLIEGGASRFAEAKLDALSEALEAVIKASTAECESLPQTSASALGLANEQAFRADEEALRKSRRSDGGGVGYAGAALPLYLTARQPSQKENAMPMQRYSEGRDRDERGRFVPEDERERSRGGYRGGPERDEQGRFYERARPALGARRTRSLYERERPPLEDRYEDEEEGYRRPMSRSRGYEDDERYSRRDESRGRSGWYGDPEGHSEASRRGWRNSEHGESGGHGDREGHSEASRRGWRNPEHGESGWFGDREGHSEAARRGWEEGHEGVSRSRSRYEDDDRRRYESRGGGRYEDDDEIPRSRPQRQRSARVVGRSRGSLGSVTARLGAPALSIWRLLD